MTPYLIGNPTAQNQKDSEYAQKTVFELTGAQIVQYFDSVVIV